MSDQAKQATAGPLLELDHLHVTFGDTVAVKDVTLAIQRGERVALVGESGSGKSVTALSILRLLGDAEVSGAIRFNGEDLLAKSEREMRGLRGSAIAMIFQEPMTALNPLYTVGVPRKRASVLLRYLNARASRSRANASTVIRINSPAVNGSAR